MCEIILNLEVDLTHEELKDRIEEIAREYSLAVIESTEQGNDYPNAARNIRFLNEFLFAISCSIEDKQILNITKI